MKKILLTHSYLLINDLKQFKLGQPYAPLGTLYAASALKKSGFDITFYDPTFANSANNITPEIISANPGIVIVYDDCFNYISKMCLTNMREVCYRVIDIAKNHNCTVIICSSDATDNYKLYLDRGADFIIIGEGENTLVELTEKLEWENITDYKNIKSIAWKSSEGIMVTSQREIITDLDNLPFPAWEMLDVEKYKQVWLSKNGYFTINMVTTRGCPYQCVWCAKPIYGNHYNSRSPLNVVLEMKLLNELFDPDYIWFADDIFALKPGWIEEFARLTSEHQTVIPFTIQTRADLLLSDSQIKPLAAAGCVRIWLGVESGSQKILDAMNKGITVEQIYEASVKLKQSGIKQAFFIQLGFSGETKEDIQKTIKLLIDLMPDDIGISVTYPLPGTKFYNDVKKELTAKVNWTDSDDLDLLFNNNFSPAFYKILHRYIHKYYRFRQALYFTVNFHKKGFNTKTHMKRILLTPYYLFFTILFKIRLMILENAGK